MKSLAVCLEAPDSNNDKIKEAWEYVKDRKALKFTDEAPSIEHDAPKKSEVGDMPMTPYTEVPGRRDRRMSSWVVDVIHDWHGEIDKSTSGRLATAGLYSQLQEPLSPKTDWGVAYTMQLAASETAPGTCTIVKHFMFSERQYLASVHQHLIRGQMCLLNWWPANIAGTKKIFQKLLEDLGGFQVLYREWPSSEVTQPKRDPVRIQEGYEFIRRHGPVSNNVGQFVEWTDVHVNDPNSKIFGWPEGKVKEFLNARARGKQTAKTLEKCFTTYKSFHPWFLDRILKGMIMDHEEHGILWVGITQCGKSLAAKTHGFQVSKHHIDKHEKVDVVPSIMIIINIILCFSGLIIFYGHTTI